MKKIDYYIKKYLENRPMFMTIIRSQEAMLFQKYIKFVKGKVLDFGCGDGFFAQTVFGKKTIDVGLDLYNSRAETAEKEGVYKRVVYYDGRQIPYPDNYFQTVISNCVLEHIPNLKNSLEEVCQVLKPGGYFITTVMTDKWNDYLLGKRLFGNWYISYMKNKQQHFNLLSYEKWRNIFELNKFKIVKNIGYMNKKNSQFMDIAHYLSFHSLITYRLFNNWQLFPKITTFLWENKIKKNVCLNVLPNKSAALFFVLKK